MSEDDDGFFARWSQRKAKAQRGESLPPEPAVARAVPAPAAAAEPAPPAPAAGAAAVPAPAPAPLPPPTLDEVAALPADAADFSRFVGREVDPAVRHAALKKLFSDPRFNTMDGLDVYIDDYSRPDPLPAGWLGRLAQSGWIGGAAPPPPLPAAAPDPVAAAAAPEPSPPTDEDADLRLQPHDAARPEGDRGGAGEDAAGEP